MRSLGLHSYRVAPEVMSLEFLKNITNDFSKERELGSGTFGKVYKASKKIPIIYMSNYNVLLNKYSIYLHKTILTVTAVALLIKNILY